MAIRPNEDRHNRHALVIGKTGSGKTYWLQRHPKVAKRGARVLVWDPYESYHGAGVRYADNLATFAQWVAKGVQSGKGYRLGLAVNATPDSFEAFCRIVWAALDGAVETVVIVEELGDVARTAKAAPQWGRLVRVGRKFGAVLMPTTQRPQEIDKTIFTQVAMHWVGLVSAYDRAYVEKACELQRGVLAGIKPESYEFALCHGGRVQWGGPKRKVKLPA